MAKPNEARMTKLMTEKGIKLEDLAATCSDDSLPLEERCFAAAAYAQVSKVGLYDDEVVKSAEKLQFIDLTKKGPELTSFVEHNKE